MAFHGTDYYGIDDLLTDEERLTRETVRAFVDAEVLPIIGQHFRAGIFPRALVPKLAGLGVLGASLHGYGCAGMGPAPLKTLTEARYGITWGAIGAAMACYEEALGYAKDRVQFARPIAGYQLTQAKLVEMLQEITKAQLLSWRLGGLKAAGRVRPAQVSLAKRNNVHAALVIARTAREILGANGILDDYQCGRHMMNLESSTPTRGRTTSTRSWWARTSPGWRPSSSARAPSSPPMHWVSGGSA